MSTLNRTDPAGRESFRETTRASQEKYNPDFDRQQHAVDKSHQADFARIAQLRGEMLQMSDPNLRQALVSANRLLEIFCFPEQTLPADNVASTPESPPQPAPEKNLENAKPQEKKPGDLPKKPDFLPEPAGEVLPKEFEALTKISQLQFKLKLAELGREKLATLNFGAEDYGKWKEFVERALSNLQKNVNFVKDSAAREELLRCAETMTLLATADVEALAPMVSGKAEFERTPNIADPKTRQIFAGMQGELGRMCQQLFYFSQKQAPAETAPSGKINKPFLVAAIVALVAGVGLVILWL